jgi:hypothetical protein
MNLPYALQLAHGWTRLSLLLNLAVAAAIVPALFLAVNSFGAIGAAMVWTATNLTLVCISVPATHRRLMGDPGWYWFADVARVLLVALIVVGSWRMISSAPAGSPLTAVVVLAAATTATVASAAVSPACREWIMRYLAGRFDRLA